MIRGVCIGGPRDGLQIAAYGNKVRLAELAEPARAASAEEPNRSAPITREVEYRLEMLHTDRGTIDLWVWSELAIHDAMVMLVGRYAPAADPQQSATPETPPDTP